MPDSAERDRLQVVLVAARNPLNIGAAARAMSNFGFSHLRVVNPYQVAFREARSAVGASGLLAGAKEFNSVADAVADCTLVVGTTAGRHRELKQPLHQLRDGTRLIRGKLACGKVAVLFGSEKFGLSNTDLGHCHWLLRIPTSQHLSMNLGQAVAVCLYELVRNVPGVAPKETLVAATAGDLERLTQMLLQALLLSDYVKPRSSKATEEKVRRMVRRLRLSSADTVMWLGMLRKIVWKLHSASGGDR